MTDTNGEVVQEVCCDECGESLGYQAAGTNVQRELWRHNRCPVRVARQLGLTRTQYETAFAVTAGTINDAYPDFPDATLNEPSSVSLRTFRAELAAGAVLEALSVIGYTLRKQ